MAKNDKVWGFGSKKTETQRLAKKNKPSAKKRAAKRAHLQVEQPPEKKVK